MPQVHVFDVKENIWAALCVQKVARKTRLTKVAFNSVHPVIVVGDDRSFLSVFLYLCISSSCEESRCPIFVAIHLS